jgi:membrane protease YdiL (CAAX protease family)
MNPESEKPLAAVSASPLDERDPIDPIDYPSISLLDVPRRPQIWPVFVVWLIAMVAILLTQIVACVVWLIALVAQGGDLQQVAKDLPELAMSPAGFIALGSLSQFVIGVTGYVAGMLSRTPTLERLGMVRPSVPAWTLPIHAIGTLVPFAVGILFAWLLSLWVAPDMTAQRLYDQMTWQWAGPFLAFISIVPGFCEEMFFRGFMQRRLLERWSPWLAIPVVSVLFGLAHMQLHTIVFATVVGVWFGVLAWRTGSIWPGALAHGFVNGAWNVWHIGVALNRLPAEPPLYVAIPLSVILLACFCVSFWMLMRRPKTRIDTDPHESDLLDS